MNVVRSTVLGSIATLFLATTGFAQSDRVYSIPDDTRFSQQNFSQALFQQIAFGGRACKAFGLKELCSYKRKHVFRDAVLMTEKRDTASVAVTMVPKQPLSQQQALSYSRILDRRGEINFANPDQQAGKATYKGCAFDGGMKRIFLCRAELSLTAGGTVAKIFVQHESP